MCAYFTYISTGSLQEAYYNALKLYAHAHILVSITCIYSLCIGDTIEYIQYNYFDRDLGALN